MVSGATEIVGKKDLTTPILDFRLTLVIKGHRSIENKKGNDFRDWPFTWADLDEAIVLNEDGVTGQVAMNDGGGHMSAGSWRQRGIWLIKMPPKLWRLVAFEMLASVTLSRIDFWNWMLLSNRADYLQSRREPVSQAYLRADSICVHQRFQACRRRNTFSFM